MLKKAFPPSPSSCLNGLTHMVHRVPSPHVYVVFSYYSAELSGYTAVGLWSWMAPGLCVFLEQLSSERLHSFSLHSPQNEFHSECERWAYCSWLHVYVRICGRGTSWWVEECCSSCEKLLWALQWSLMVLRNAQKPDRCCIKSTFVEPHGADLQRRNPGLRKLPL